MCNVIQWYSTCRSLMILLLLRLGRQYKTKLDIAARMAAKIKGFKMKSWRCPKLFFPLILVSLYMVILVILVIWDFYPTDYLCGNFGKFLSIKLRIKSTEPFFFVQVEDENLMVDHQLTSWQRPPSCRRDIHELSSHLAASASLTLLKKLHM